MTTREFAQQIGQRLIDPRQAVIDLYREKHSALGFLGSRRCYSHMGEALPAMLAGFDVTLSRAVDESSAQPIRLEKGEIEGRSDHARGTKRGLTTKAGQQQKGVAAVPTVAPCYLDTADGECRC